MGEAKRRKNEIVVMKARNPVRHITKHSWFNIIVDSNTLELEGSNTHAIPQIPSHIEMLNAQYALVGRYVWFTKQRHARCAGANSELYFEFDQNKMGFEKWSEIVSRLTGSARKLADILNWAARHRGDDPDQWFVSRVPVSLDNCVNKHMFETMRRQANAIDLAFQTKIRELDSIAHAANDYRFTEVA